MPASRSPRGTRSSKSTWPSASGQRPRARRAAARRCLGLGRRDAADPGDPGPRRLGELLVVLAVTARSRVRSASGPRRFASSTVSPSMPPSAARRFSTRAHERHGRAQHRDRAGADVAAPPAADAVARDPHGRTGGGTAPYRVSAAVALADRRAERRPRRSRGRRGRRGRLGVAGERVDLVPLLPAGAAGDLDDDRRAVGDDRRACRAGRPGPGTPSHSPSTSSSDRLRMGRVD